MTPTDIVEKLIVSDDQERRHIERIHILITTLIIASYFTNPFQNFIKINDIKIYSDIITMISIFYLTFRLIDITIPLRDLDRRIFRLFNFFAPVGFLISVLGYLSLTIISILKIKISIIILTVLIASILIFSVLLSLVSIKYEADEKEQTHMGGLEYEEYVLDNLDKIESGLELERTPLGNGPYVDFTGSDAFGNKIVVEVKRTLVDTRVVSQIETIARAESPDRLLIVSDRDATRTAKQRIEDAKNMEFHILDPEE